jgi:hypothetical protein
MKIHFLPWPIRALHFPNDERTAMSYEEAMSWLPCDRCEATGVDSSECESPMCGLNPCGCYSCPSCNGVGWLPSPAVLEAMAEGMYPPPAQPNANALKAARAAWEAQVRHILEGEK